MTPQTPSLPPGKTPPSQQAPMDLRPGAKATPPQQSASLWDEFTERPQVNALIERWRGFTARPENRAALLQFSINALQPVMPGQSTLGHIASAAGAGMAARDRYAQGQIAAEESAAQSARESAAMDLDRQQLDINRQNAETAARNSGQQGDGYLEWFTQQMEYVVQNAFTDQEGLGEIQRMWFNGTPEEKAQVDRMFREQYQMLTQGGGASAAPGGTGAPQMGDTSQGLPAEGDIVAALNAQFPNAPAGTRKYLNGSNVAYVKQQDGSWVRA